MNGSFYKLWIILKNYFNVLMKSVEGKTTNKILGCRKVHVEFERKLNQIHYEFLINNKGVTQFYNYFPSHR